MKKDSVTLTFTHGTERWEMVCNSSFADATEYFFSMHELEPSRRPVI
jgi:hypothetical protein